MEQQTQMQIRSVFLAVGGILEVMETQLGQHLDLVGLEVRAARAVLLFV
jgi:hypothetical protein